MTRSREREARATEVDALLSAASAAGPGSPEYAAAIAHEGCVAAIVARAERHVEYALDGGEYDDVQIWYLADLVKAWRPVFSEDRLDEFADELRGAPVLKGLARTFGSEPWWPR